MKKLVLFFALMGTLLASPVFAYVGPGAGISLLGSVATTLMVVLLAVAAILFWPVRYLWRRMRNKSRPAVSEADSDTGRDA